MAIITGYHRLLWFITSLALVLILAVCSFAQPRSRPFYITVGYARARFSEEWGSISESVFDHPSYGGGNEFGMVSVGCGRSFLSTPGEAELVVGLECFYHRDSFLGPGGKRRHSDLFAMDAYMGVVAMWGRVRLCGALGCGFLYAGSSVVIDSLLEGSAFLECMSRRFPEESITEFGGTSRIYADYLLNERWFLRVGSYLMDPGEVGLFEVFRWTWINVGYRL